MDIYQIIIKEIENVLLSVDRQEIKILKQEILMARRIYVAGAGRSGLVAGSFAMRLCQLGLCAFLVGEVTATAIGEGDLLILISGSGNTESIVRFSQKAKQEKTKVALLTVSGEGRAAANCGLIIKMPGTCEKDVADRKIGMERTRQPMGALFEQSVLLLLDGLVLELMESLQETSQTMMRRHANLE